MAVSSVLRSGAMLPGACVLAIMRYPTIPDRFASETLQGQSPPRSPGHRCGAETWTSSIHLDGR
jgi:hypothetical protein